MAPSALKVLYRLKSKGFMALLVGGALRDLYRDKTPRDFDIATDASIDEIRAQFRNSKTIGKRFPIVHTYFGNEVVEISSLKGEQALDRYQLIYEDACRRDFTVNAIYYDINDFSVIDPLDAIDDVHNGRVVSIGPPAERFEEDPIRMLRAVKLAAKQGFNLSEDVAATIRDHQDWTDKVGAGRRYEEITRVILDENAAGILETCRKHGLFVRLWPQGVQLLENLGLPYFEEARDNIPLIYSRGSFAKQSHTHLWLYLFLGSTYFEPSTSPAILRDQFARFLGPLGMPFQGPVVDAALWLSHAMLRTGIFPSAGALNGEIRELLLFFANRLDEEQRETFIKAISKPRKRRRRRRSKAEGEQRAMANGDAPPKPKKRRRRRRRRPSGEKSKSSDES